MNALVRFIRWLWREDSPTARCETCGELLPLVGWRHDEADLMSECRECTSRVIAWRAILTPNKLR